LFAAPGGVDPQALVVPGNLPEFEEAKDIIATIDRSRRARIAYWNRIDGQMQARTVEKDAIERGMAQGITEGIAEGRMEGLAEGETKLAATQRDTAAKLKAMGLSIDQISEATGLTEAELRDM